MFRWIFRDGSWFVLANEAWREAIVWRLQRDAERLRLFDEGFVRAVEDHWERRTLPGRWGEEEPWERAFANRAELAEEVVRRLVAPVLLGLALKAEHAATKRVPAQAPVLRGETKIRLRGRS